MQNSLIVYRRFASLRGTKQSRCQAIIWIASSCLLAMTENIPNKMIVL